MAPRYKEDILRERFRRSVAGGSIADHSSLQEALDGDEPASSAFSQASVQYHASDDFRRLIDELGSIISRSAAQPEHELDKELGARPFTPPEPQRAQTATVPPTALPRRRLLTALSGRQLTNRHVVVGVIAIALMAVLLLGGMIHRVWFAGLRNDAPAQLAIETNARVSIPRSRLPKQPQSASETTDRADFSTSGL